MSINAVNLLKVINSRISGDLFEFLELEMGELSSQVLFEFLRVEWTEGPERKHF